jgi:hypothetical protein
MLWYFVCGMPQASIVCLRPDGCHVNSHRYAQSGKAQHNGMAVAPNIMKLGLVVDFLFF